MKKIALFVLVLALGIAFLYLGFGKNRQIYSYESQKCASEGPASECLYNHYRGLVDNFGITTAVSDLKRRTEENGGVLSQCHPLMHIIGEEAAKSYPDVSSAFADGDPFCWSGYYHGVLEGITAYIGEEKLLSQLNQICSGIKGKEIYSFDYYNCVHGLGHGIMELKSDELFESLNICDGLKGDWEKQSCQSGVFMENVMLFSRFGESKYLKKDDPMYPCNAVDDRYKFQCYLGQTSFALESSNYNFERVSALCAEAPDKYRDTCFQSLGRDAANQALHEANKTKTICSIPKDGLDAKNCIIGAVKEMISYYHSDKEAKDFCSILGPNSQICLATTASYYELF